VKLAVMASLACACWARAAPEHEQGLPSGKLDRVTGTVIGQVVAESGPARHFGVTLTRSVGQLEDYERTVEVSATDGRFRVASVEPGKWELILASPEFAQRVVSGVEIARGSTRDLGTINVSRGFRIDGRVTDARMTPVPDAEVTIRQRGYGQPLPEAERNLSMLAHGVLVARTDAFGMFVIENFAELEDNFAMIVARARDRRVSVYRFVPNYNATLDLVVAPTGTLEGTITGDGPRAHVVAMPVGVSQPAPFYAKLGDNRFRFEDLPEGDYNVFVVDDDHTSNPSIQRISITAGTSSQTTLAGP
jgi:hypothetical protein